MQSQDDKLIRFVLDGEPVEVARTSPTATLLDWLCEHGRCGVKEGCAEGDCGACTVAIGELDGERIRTSAVNACIRFLPTIDGMEVTTVHGLRNDDGSLHPAQQAMVDCHGSQCGFCTPGFVMSLFTHYLDNEGQPATRDGVVHALTGNLCRCTGYRPIIDAGLAMHRYPRASFNGKTAARVARLKALQRSTSLVLPGFAAPRSADEFAAAYEANPQALVLAGGTDVGLWVTKQMRDLPTMLYLGEVAEFGRIENNGAHLRIGAAVTLEKAFAAIVTDYPSLKELHLRFASRPVRNSGTLCGNVANGSPIGDAMPALIALGATACLRKGQATREIALEDLYLGYQKKDLAPGEFVEAVKLPLPVHAKAGHGPADGQKFALYKISKRFDQDISAVCAGIAVTLEAGRVSAARIAFGGMAATPKRALAAEAALTGKAWSAETIEAAARAIADDFQPLTDMRASDAYRLTVAANLLRRFWHEVAGDAVSVSAMDALPAQPVAEGH